MRKYLAWLLLMTVSARAAVLPSIDLSQLEPAVRQQIQLTLHAVSTALDNPALPTERRARAWGELGMLFQAYTFDQQALISYQQAIQYQPSNPVWHYLSAQALRSNTDINDALDRALGHLEAAHSRAPDTIWVLNALIEVNLDAEQLDQAEQWLDRLLKLQPEHVNALVSRGRLMQLRADYPASIEPLRKALALAPNATRIHYPLGIAYRATGQTELALHHLKLAGNTSFDEPDPWMAQVQSLARSMRVSQLRGLEAARAGRMDLALELLGDSVEQDPDNASARVNLATALIMNGQPDKAHAHLNKAIDSEPGLHIAHYNLASLLAEEGRDTEAMVHFRQAAALSASHRDTYFGLAHCQMRLGESVEAIESYRQVIRIDPSSKAARYWLGMAQARSRQYADAMNTLQLALSLNPGQSAVANALVRVTALTMDANEQQQRQALELANRLMQARPSVEHGLTQAMIQYAYGERADAMTRMLQVEQYRNQVGDPVMNAFVQQVGKQITDQQPLSTPWPEAAAIYQPAASLRLQLQDSRAQ